jgi:DNA-directed RNA polymerase subunit K/omega
MRYTKKYIQKCYTCDKSVGGAYNEQDKIVRAALNEAEWTVDGYYYQYAIQHTAGRRARDIIDTAYEILNN